MVEVDDDELAREEDGVGDEVVDESDDVDMLAREEGVATGVEAEVEDEVEEGVDDELADDEDEELTREEGDELARKEVGSAVVEFELEDEAKAEGEVGEEDDEGDEGDELVRKEGGTAVVDGDADGEAVADSISVSMRQRPGQKEKSVREEKNDRERKER